jgi:MerR family transcriptional regulator, light-induced transcriptional regulator
MADNTPLYNLKAVTNEVGINPVTLRAWERRYDLLKPKRSPGGHRLYSRQDIEMLKWLIERQAEGLSISSAIEMWKNQHQDDLGSLQLVQIPVYEIGTGESTLDILRTRWIAACLAFDDLHANQILDEAFAVAAPEMIIREVIQKGLVRIGEGWFSGSVSVQQEHFASAIAVQRINVLLAAVAPPTRPGHILVACPPGEEHDFILLIITYLLRRSGWDVVYLGSNVPIIDLDITIRSTSPVLFISGAQTLITAASLRAMSEYLITQSVPLAYGGGIFNQVPAATKCISGYFLGTEVESVPQTVEQLISTHPPMSTAQPVPLQYAQILTKYLQNEWAIITHLSSSFRSELVKPAQLDNANENLNQSVISALAMGDINLLDHFILWLNGMLKTYGLSASLVKEYFTTYRLEVEHYLGDDASIIQGQLAKCETSL